MRSDGELVCVAPLMESRTRFLGLPLKRIGSLHEFYEPVCGFILANDAERAIKLVWKHLRKNHKDWDSIELRSLPMLSGTLTGLENVVRRDGFWLSIRELKPSPFVDTSGTWDSYLASKSRSRRKNWKRVEKRISDEGGASVLSVRGGKDLDHYLKTAFEIESSGWKGRAGTAIFHTPGSRSLYTSFGRLAARNGWLSLDFLMLRDEEPIAFEYNIVFAGSLYSHKAGYLEKWSSLGPGKLLTKRVLERCFNDDVRRYDFQGSPTPLTIEFATGLQRRFRMRIYNRNLKGCILFAIDCIVIPIYKRLIPLTYCHGPRHLWRRILDILRYNILGNEPVLVFEKDLRCIQPIKPHVPHLSFHLATVEEISEAAADPEYRFSRKQSQEISMLAGQGDVCVIGKLSGKIVHYQWICFRSHTLSKNRVLDLGGQKPFIFRSRTLSEYRGRGVFSAALSYTYSYLKSRGLDKCYVDIPAKVSSCVREIKMTGARLVGRFRMVSIFGIKRAVVPERLLKRIAVPPYWLR